MHPYRIGDLVLYKNNQLLAMNKPAGVPVQPDPSGDTSLLQMAEIFAKHKIQLIHRLDRPVSGLVLFGKNPKAAAALGAQFAERKIEKTYLAIVPKGIQPETGQLEHYLWKNPKHRKAEVVEAEREGAQRAVLAYRRLASIDHYDLLEITLRSGRFHQIRAQLSHVHGAVQGDQKYGAKRGNSDRSIGLHAWKLRFHHPVSGEEVELEAPLPDSNIWQAFNLPS